MAKIGTRKLAVFGSFILLMFGWQAAMAQRGGPPAPTPQEPSTPSGPYKPVMEGDPGLVTHTIYRPEDIKSLPKKMKLPIVAFGNGGCANSSAGFRNLLNEIASHGFLVVAIGPPSPIPGAPRAPTKSSQLLDAISWATAENTRDGSMYKGKIAISKVAVMGQSCGGLQALEVSPDPRIATSVILSGGIPDPGAAGIAAGAPQLSKDILQKLHAPTIYLFGGPSDIAYKFCMDDFSRIEKIPAFSGSLTAVGHNATYSQPNGGEFGRVITAWLEWQLQGNKSAKKMFTGSSCELCTNSNWKVAQKNVK